MKTNWLFDGKFADKGDNPNIEGDNMLSPG